MKIIEKKKFYLILIFIFLFIHFCLDLHHFIFLNKFFNLLMMRVNSYNNLYSLLKF